MAQSVEPLISAQIMISQFMGLSPVLGSVLTAQSLEPASDSVSLSDPPMCTFCLSLFLKNKQQQQQQNKIGSYSIVRIVWRSVLHSLFRYPTQILPIVPVSSFLIERITLGACVTSNCHATLVFSSPKQFLGIS